MTHEMSLETQTLDDFRQRLDELFVRVPRQPVLSPASKRIGRSASARNTAAACSSRAAPGTEDLSTNTFRRSAQVIPPVLYSWAMDLRYLLDDYLALVSLASSMIHSWRDDDSDDDTEHAWNILSMELTLAQAHMTAQVEPWLSRVLATDMRIVERTAAARSEHAMEQNLVDYDHMDRQVATIRHIVLANIDRLIKAIDDSRLAQTA